MTRPLRARHGQGPGGRSAVLRPGHCRPAPRRRPVSPGVRGHGRRGRLGVAGSLAAAGARCQGYGCGGGAPAPAGRPAEPVHQDSRHARGRGGHRSIDFCRRAGQRHAAVFGSAVPGGSRGVSARHRAARGRRPGPEGEFGGLALRQPLGRGRQQAVARARCTTAWALRWRRRPTAPTASCWPRRAGTNSPPLARTCSACCGPAPAPKTLRRPTPCTSRRWPRPTPSTPYPKKRCLRFLTTARCSQACKAMAATAATTIAQCREAGIDIDALAEQLQREGAESFSQSWAKLLDNLANKATPSPAKTAP
jgi:hypothetical protein